jgi:predicted ArsR family transcriptional regulator
LRITDARLAAVFADPLRRRLLLRLTGHERSLADLARVEGLELKRVHYHVTVLHALGLLVVMREKPRAGRAVKMYRASADAFFVPAKFMGVGASATLAVEMGNSLARLRDQSLDGVVYDLGEGDVARMRSLTRPRSNAAPAAENWKVLRLSRSEALRLARDISLCIEACAERHRAGGDVYLVHFALAPRTPVRRRASG